LDLKICELRIKKLEKATIQEATWGDAIAHAIFLIWHSIILKM
jgi:hypothetical protein